MKKVKHANCEKYDYYCFSCPSFNKSEGICMVDDRKICDRQCFSCINYKFERCALMV